MDKIDGPYYFFKAIQKVRHTLPEWFPLVGLEVGRTNIVPVDYVAAAMDHIAHLDGLDGQAFHLVDPKMQQAGDVINTFAERRPRAADGHARRQADDGHAPEGRAVLRDEAAGAQGHPALGAGRPRASRTEVLDYVALKPTFDARDTKRALEGSGIEIPPLETYAEKLWDYWERNLDPDLFKDRSFEGAINGKTVIITGASSGIGLAAAHKIAAAGGIPILVARSVDKARRPRRRSSATAAPPTPTPPTSRTTTRSTRWSRRSSPSTPRSTSWSTTPGRSIRRSVEVSYDRFHDYERTVKLNYLGTIKLILGVLPHMREKKAGHIVNVSSIGVQTNPPRFSAYVASKAALDAFTRVVSSETIGDNVTFTTIHMPLVRTPMIAPTKIYDSFPTISPEEAADLICEAIRAKPKQINTRLGTFGEVLYALAPKAVDQILHMAYKVFPESTKKKEGEEDGPGDRPSGEAMALAHLMKGVHW